MPTTPKINNNNLEKVATNSSKQKVKVDTQKSTEIKTDAAKNKTTQLNY